MNFNIISLRAGRILKPVKIAFEDKRIFLKFGYNKKLLEEIKKMEGAQWHGFDKPPLKAWSIKNSKRNLFQLKYLQGKNPYKRYDEPLSEIEVYDRPLYANQLVGTSHMLQRRQCILAGEMGVGKTLMAIVTMEKSGVDDWWFVGTPSSLLSVELELEKWESRVSPRLLTYDGLKKVIREWDGGSAPQGVVFDESARIKNCTSQRSQAAMHLADAIRDEHGDDGYIILMTGTPAPKSPLDWWNQSETACPGFLVEGSVAKLRSRLCLVKQEETLYGKAYPRIVTWFDNEKKCKVCGQFENEAIHYEYDVNYHPFEPSINEIDLLYKRLKGLVLVQFKKDCYDLPDKVYKIIKVQPTPSMLRVAEAIATTATSTIKALTLLRELSDGFQYTKNKVGNEVCSVCNGEKIIPIPDPEKYKDGVLPDGDIKYIDNPCPNCNGTGEQVKYERSTSDIHSPKDDALLNILDDHDDVGRLVVFAGFTGSIDKICRLVNEQGWTCLRIDGRGYKLLYPDGEESSAYKPAIRAMDKKTINYELFDKLVVVGHPGSASEGLTFTASPTIVYYSNDFTGMYRMQSEDRIHRLGMDTEKGATIIDIFNLPTDEYVYNNLKQKRDLQTITLGKIQEVFDATIDEGQSRRPMDG